MQLIISTGECKRVPFDETHFRAVGVSPRMLGGMPQLEAHQLVNKWNVSQISQRYVYGLE